MAITFGWIIKDRKLRNMGFKNLLVCLFVTISFGKLVTKLKNNQIKLNLICFVG